MSNFLENKSNQSIITQLMLNNLEYDQGIQQSNTMTPRQVSGNGNKPLAMFVFHQGDIDAASHYLAKSLEDTMNSSAIKCVFVQESCVQRFVEKLKSKLKPLPKEQFQEPNLKKSIEKANEIINKLHAETIRPQDCSAPIVVLDFPHEHFTANGDNLPVVTLMSFRTAKEAIALLRKESICKAATIWCENQAMAYEVIAETPLHDYYLNCCNVSFAPIQQYIAKAQPFALIENSYHYETLGMAENQKNIVFPFGTIFAN